MALVEKIQYSDEFLKEENIIENINVLWEKAIPILQHRKELYERYTRKNNVNDGIVALEFYISTISSGYFGGKEPQYKVKKMNDTQKGLLKKVFQRVFGDKNNPDEFQTIIDYIKKYNHNGNFFYDCVKDYINTGACYGLVYENKHNEIVYSHISSLTSVAIWNCEIPSQKIGLLTYWTENLNNGGLEIHLQLLTRNYKKHYIGSIKKSIISENCKTYFKEVQEDNKEVLWEDLPVFAVENPDGLALYENVITLINKQEEVVRNSDKQKNTYLDLVLMICGIPNWKNDRLIYVHNSSAFVNIFFPLDLVLQQADKLFRKELLRMWQIIIARINLKKNTEFDFKDIEVILTRNVPINQQEITDNWLKLRGLISDNTVIDHLPYDLDSESELAKRDRHNETEM